MNNNNSSKGIEYKRILGISFIVALFIFVIGFGVMSIFWLQAKTVYTGDRGFLYYKAATWGDGICLPLLVGSLLAYKMFLGESTKEQKVISYAIGTAMGIIGAVVQLSWIISDKVIPNWTIEVHKFMPSGWYHAGYFVFMFWIIATLLAQVFFSRKNNLLKEVSCEYVEVVVWIKIIIWFSGLGYIFMNSIDDRFTSDGYMQQSIITLILFAVGALIYNFLSRSSESIRKSKNMEKQRRSDMKKQGRTDFVAIIIGCLSALGFGLSVYYGAREFVTAFICATFSVAYVKPNMEQALTTGSYIFKVALPTFFLALVATNSSNMYIRVGFSILTLLVALFISPTPSHNKGRKRYKYKVVGTLLMFLALFQGFLFSEFGYVNEVSELMSSVASGIVTIVCAIYIPLIFKENIVNEEIKYEKVDKKIYIAYLMMFFVGLGGVLMLVVSLRMILLEFATGSSFDFAFGMANKNLILLGILSVAIIALILIKKFIRVKTVIIKSVTVILILVSYLCIFFNIISMEMAEFIGGNHWIEIIFGAISLWVVISASAFVMFGFYENLVSIRGIKNNTIIPRLSAIITFLGCLVCCVVSVLAIDSANLGITSIPRFGVSIIAIIVSVIVLPTLCSAIIQSPEILDEDVTKNTASSGVFHVGVLMSGAIVMGALSELFVISMVSAFFEKSVNMIVYINFFIILMVFVGVIYKMVKFCLEMNVKHMNMRISEANQTEAGQRALHLLNNHLRKQSILVVIMFFPYLIIPILLKIIVCYTKSDSIGSDTKQVSVLIQIRDKYIPIKYIGKKINE